jgi:hypothetical protein
MMAISARLVSVSVMSVSVTNRAEIAGGAT